MSTSPLEGARSEAARLEIVAVDLYAFDIPLKAPFKIALGTLHAAGNVLVAVRTNAGVVGLGEGSPFPPITGETQEATLDVCLRLREVVLGRSPLAIESLGAELAPFRRRHPSAVAAFETALWDILGKVAGLPLYRLFGGDRSSFGTDITTYLGEPETMAAEAVDFVRRGFDTIKIKVGEGREIDLRRLATIREAIGGGPRIRIDANQGWSPLEAIETLARMQPFNVEFVEQPVAAADVAGLKAVHQASPIPVMADEAVFGPADALRLIKAEACASFNIKLMKAGGILEMVRIAHLAEAAGLPCMVGAMIESRLGLTAAAHVVASHRNVVFADLDAHDTHAVDPVAGGMVFGKGTVTLPDLPGIGAEIDPAFLKTLRKL